MIQHRPLVAFLDASVLYPALLRNMLMHFAVGKLYRPRWSAQVHEEWITAILRNHTDVIRAQLERTRQLMEVHVPEALVDGYKHLISSIILPDENDRHVLAAAIHCEASVIVTANLRDFPDCVLAHHNMIAKHPDDFLFEILESNKDQAFDAFSKLCEYRKNPVQAPQEVIAILNHQGLVKTAKALTTLFLVKGQHS